MNGDAAGGRDRKAQENSVRSHADPSFGLSWRAGSARKLLSLQDLE
jgi:hypothetical protein